MNFQQTQSVLGLQTTSLHFILSEFQWLFNGQMPRLFDYEHIGTFGTLDSLALSLRYFISFLGFLLVSISLY